MTVLPNHALSTGDAADAPAHVAIIMDGNGRWATQRGLPRTAGHKAGMEAVRATLEAARDLGIQYLTLFGFSAENWRRPPDEVSALMGLLRLYLRREISTLERDGVRLRFIGDRDRLPEDLVAMIGDAETRTAANDQFFLTVALSYGGRQEIVSAARSIAEDVAAGWLDPAAVDDDAVSARMFTRHAPDPDLLIRTSGEQRISNFLLWQLAYTELVFMDVLWPDFGAEALREAVATFQARERRFGALGG